MSLHRLLTISQAQPYTAWLRSVELREDVLHLLLRDAHGVSLTHHYIVVYPLRRHGEAAVAWHRLQRAPYEFVTVELKIPRDLLEAINQVCEHFNKSMDE